MKTNIIIWLLFSCAIISFAQNRVVLKSSGEIITAAETTTSLNLKNEKTDKRRKNTNTSSQSLQTKSVDASLDTLTYFRDYTPNTNFGIFGQDWLLQWFIAPSDMIIHKAGISVFDAPNSTVQLEIKLVRLVWNKNELKNMGTKRLGFYRADSNGYNNITAFQDNPDRTGGWIDSSGSGLASPFAEDIWSDSGVGMVVYPEIIAKPNYQWIDLDILGKEVIVKSNEIIGVAVRNLHSEMDSMRVGISAGSVDGYTGFKFYSNGRLQPGIDYDWWSREYTFDFALEIELLEGGCWPFRDNAVSLIPTSLSTEPREISARINHCGVEDIGNCNVELNYSFDSGINFTKTPMTTTNSDSLVQTFKGKISGVQLGLKVIYFVSYTNHAGITFESSPITYWFPPAGMPPLLVFNGFATISGFPQSYYFGHNGSTTDKSEIITFQRDRWAYGKLTKELVDMYTNIFEITTTGPKDVNKDVNNDVIKEWLAASPSHNYFLAGDEYLQDFWLTHTYTLGTFEYDVLGISNFYEDICYEKTDPHQIIPATATAIAGTELGDSLYLKVLALNDDSLIIDPSFQLSPSYLNWIDGFETVEGTSVDIKAQGIDGNTYNVGAHRTLPAGNKIVFLAFDPLSLRGAAPNYFWYGFDRVSPLVQALRWFGADVVDVEKNISTPLTFLLSQNYPNPFNPSTVISFQLAGNSKVSLKVYDILGKEIATLVKEEKSAGSYKIDFNGSNLASGIYFYTLRAGNFVQSRKMILLK